MTSTKILFVLTVAIFNTINSLPTWNIPKGSLSTYGKPLLSSPPYTHSSLNPELLNILRNAQPSSISQSPAQSPSLSPSSIPLSATVDPLSTPPVPPSNQFSDYNTPQYSTSCESPPSFNPAESSNNLLASSSISAPTSGSTPLSSFGMDQSSTFDQVLNNNLKSPESPVQTPLMVHSKSIYQTPVIGPPPAPRPAVIPAPSPPSLPIPNLMTIEPVQLTPKVNQELLKLLSDLPATQSQEPVKTLNPNKILIPDSSPVSENPTILHPLPSTFPSTAPQPSSLPNPTQSPDSLLNFLINSPSTVKQLTSLITGFSAPNSNSNSSPTIVNQPPAAAKPSPLNMSFIRYLLTLPCFRQSFDKSYISKY